MSATIDFGIDLGTTNSSIAQCRAGEVRIFQTNELMNVTPSVVHVSKSGRMLVGRKAYDNWVQDPQNTQAEFKRWMGYSDKLAFPASGKSLTAEDLSAEVLKSLRSDAERQTHSRIDAAVITVPAAFGNLQCDATARAAKLAGFEQAPLLQEPIAAAVAYGASPASRNQRWLIFDLGGGTLDIAVVSTRNDRLAVLEHRGNNRLGGKDIDRVISEKLLLPALLDNFNLPDANSDAQAFSRLMRVLTRHAEQAKIELSTANEAIVEIFDLGDDLDGESIELSLTLSRSDLETQMTPIVDQCLELCNSALIEARIAGTDLDRVLLVGGPTQMPMLRSALSGALKAQLDYSIDPMTAVSHGAALYASTIEKTVTTQVPLTGEAVEVKSPAASTADGAVQIKLAYERASGSVSSPVIGILYGPSKLHEVKIDARGGFWTSGWIPVVSNCFQSDVLLNDAKPITQFTIEGRDATGSSVKVEPAEFSIAYMLPMASPPLPHTIAIELSTVDGRTQFDPLFKRSSPLPSEANKTYKAERTIRPSEVDATLPIKLWEIDVSDDPSEKWWAGCVHIRAKDITLPIIEGSEIELHVKIDTSRKITVEAFVPLLNKSFTTDVYVPDTPTVGGQLSQEIDLCFARLKQLSTEIYKADRDDLAPDLQAAQEQAEHIAETIARNRQSAAPDPDLSLQATRALRQIRIKLMRLEDAVGLKGGAPTISNDVRWRVGYVEQCIARYGTPGHNAEFTKIKVQTEKYLGSRDGRGLTWVYDQLWRLQRAVVDDQILYWQREFATLREPGHEYLNRELADVAIKEGDVATAAGNLVALRSVVWRLWKLQAKEQEQKYEQEAQSGLRGA